MDADGDVGLHLAIFVGGEWTGLFEHGVVDADFSDVVQQAHHIQITALGG